MDVRSSPGSGKVIANGKLRVELPTVDGDIVTYVASPDMVWRFTLDTTASPEGGQPRRRSGDPGRSVKRALDAASMRSSTLERRASRQGALK